MTVIYARNKDEKTDLSDFPDVTEPVLSLYSDLLLQASIPSPLTGQMKLTPQLKTKPDSNRGQDSGKTPERKALVRLQLSLAWLDL